MPHANPAVPQDAGFAGDAPSGRGAFPPTGVPRVPHDGSRRPGRRRLRTAALAIALCGACVGDGDGGSLYGCDGRPPLGGDGTGDGTVAVEVLSPGGGDHLAGDPVVISWRTAGGVDRVDIDLLRDGQPIAAIARAIDDVGAYEWAAPFGVASGGALQVRVADSEGRAFGDGPVFSLANWTYVRAIQISSRSDQSLTGFQVPIDLAPGAPELGHAAAGGADVRFASRLDRRDGHDLAHYVERWSPGAGARVWVRLPVLPAGGSATVYMFYGAPIDDSTSSFDEVFPNRFSSSASLSLGGLQRYDWFELEVGHTLSVGSDVSLVIQARVIRIDGEIDGVGRGHAGGPIGFAGAGPGAGGFSSGGGGGGGYGGDGGIGGFHFGYLPGAGGAEHGTADGPDIDAGSGGGGSYDAAGGNGGASVSLVGHSIAVGGGVEVAGSPGFDCNYAECGGGGAGGGILLSGQELAVTGRLSARGGDGGDGVSYYDFGGGGGGGGRIKLRYSGALELTGSVDASGGDGGYGGLGGESGDDGTVFSGLAATGEPEVVVGAENLVFPQ